MGAAEKSHRDAMNMVALASELERATSSLMFHVAGGVKMLAAYCSEAVRNGTVPKAGLTPVEVGECFIKDLQDCIDTVEQVIASYQEDGGSRG